MIQEHSCLPSSEEMWLGLSNRISSSDAETTAERHKHYDDESPSHWPPPALPDDLIFEILVRLPVRSLLQFKCVCKSWKTPISDPLFTKHHLLTSTADQKSTRQRLASSINFNHHGIVTFSVQSLFQNPSNAETFTFRMSGLCYIIGSCNGLLCLFDIHDRSIRLWNPTTRLESRRFQLGRPTALAPHGFGYDHLNDRYKVLVTMYGFHETVTKIYTFGANTWTVIQNFPHRPTRMLGKFVNGALHWIAKKGVSDDQWVILRLDLGKETYGEVLMPDYDGDKISKPVLLVMRECLCLSSFDSNIGHWVVWLMKEYGVPESWTKLMVIPHIGHKFSRPYLSINPVCISENSAVLLKSKSRGLVLCNLNDGRLAYPKIRSKPGLCLHPHVYHESLVSPQC